MKPKGKLHHFKGVPPPPKKRMTHPFHSNPHPPSLHATPAPHRRQRRPLQRRVAPQAAALCRRQQRRRQWPGARRPWGAGAKQHHVRLASEVLDMRIWSEETPAVSLICEAPLCVAGALPVPFLQWSRAHPGDSATKTKPRPVSGRQPAYLLRVPQKEIPVKKLFGLICTCWG